MDEFGRLYSEGQAWAPKEKRLDALKDIIRSWYPDLPADQALTIPAPHFDIQLSEKPIEKKWKSMAAVCKAVGGLKHFLTVCEVTFKALSEKIGNSAAEALQIEARTGKRKVKAVARLAPVIELPKAA